MARLIDSDFLFGNKTGVSTCGGYTCAYCGTKDNEGNDEAQNYDGDSIPVEYFAGLSVCYECYETIETEIINRMPQILAWYKKYFIDNNLRLKIQVEELLNKEKCYGKV